MAEGKDSPDLTTRIRRFFRGVYKVVSSHGGLIVVLIAYSFAGAAIFQALEGPHETREKHDIIALREDIIHNIWNQSQLLEETEEDFAKSVQYELKRYEAQLYTAYSHGIQTDSEDTIWDFWGSLFFCATIYTTIGYGHIAPATDAGRIATMVYGLVGIPLCLVVLAEVGKLFTRIIKFPWAFIRRFYHTGHCKKVRQAKAVQMLGEQLEKLDPRDAKQQQAKQEEEEEVPETYEVDDEFNLPPIIAVTITVVYIFLGAVMYMQWEDWSYLEAFYFVFVSISTIGFGDVLPEHPKRFLASFVYLLVGLSLVAMVINVVMEVVNDTIDKAKMKVFEVGRKTIGINLDPDADVEEEQRQEQEKKAS